MKQEDNENTFEKRKPMESENIDNKYNFNEQIKNTEEHFVNDVESNQNGNVEKEYKNIGKPEHSTVSNSEFVAESLPAQGKFLIKLRK